MGNTMSTAVRSAQRLSTGARAVASMPTRSFPLAPAGLAAFANPTTLNPTGMKMAHGNKVWFGGVDEAVCVSEKYDIKRTTITGRLQRVLT